MILQFSLSRQCRASTSENVVPIAIVSSVVPSAIYIDDPEKEVQVLHAKHLIGSFSLLGQPSRYSKKRWVRLLFALPGVPLQHVYLDRLSSLNCLDASYKYPAA